MKILLLFLLFLFACSTEKEYILPNYKNQFYEGWGGPPFEEEKEPKEYIYTQVKGRATKKAIQTGSGGMMHNSCTASILESAGRQLSRAMLIQYKKQNRSVDSNRALKKINQRFEMDYKEPRLKECRPSAKPNPTIPYSEFKTCECIVYIRVTGGQKTIQDLFDKQAIDQ